MCWVSNGDQAAPSRLGWTASKVVSGLPRTFHPQMGTSGIVLSKLRAQKRRNEKAAVKKGARNRDSAPSFLRKPASKQAKRK